MMLIQVERKAFSLEKAHRDGAAVTCQAMYAKMNVAQHSADNLYCKESFCTLKIFPKLLFDSEKVPLPILFMGGSPGLKAHDETNFARRCQLTCNHCLIRPS